MLRANCGAALSVPACMLWGMDMPFDSVQRYQVGVATRVQVLNSGLSDDAIVHRITTGRWQRLYKGVYATFSGPVPRQARLWAAVLCAGPGAVLSHESAAEIQRLLDQPAPLISVTVPAARRVVRPTARTRSSSTATTATSRGLTASPGQPARRPTPNLTAAARASGTATTGSTG